MTFAPKPVEGFDFAINEFVWDRVWKKPAVVVGTKDDKLTVGEIVGETIGRVAHRAPDQLCRYVKLIVPEDEAEAVQSALFAESIATHDLIASFLARLQEAREHRGLVDEG